MTKRQDQQFAIVSYVEPTSSPPKQGIRFWGRFDTEKEACEVARQVASHTTRPHGVQVIVASPSGQQVILPSKTPESCKETQKDNVTTETP